MAATSPLLWLNGSSAFAGGQGTIQDGYAQLISSAGVFDQTGTKVFRMWSSLIDAASMRLVRAGVITLAQQQQNLQLLTAIANYCRQHNIVVAVEDNLTLTPLWTANWVATAKSVGLPVAYVDGGEVLLNVQDTPQALTALATQMVGDAAIIAAAYPHVQFGDVEPPVQASQSAWNQELQHWWAAFNSIAASDGIQGFSYFLGDIAWNANPNWLASVEQVGSIAAAAGLSFGAFIDASNAVSSSAGWVKDAKQHLAQLAADPSISPAFLVAESWDAIFPDSVTPINAPGSVANLADSISALFPVYHQGKITALDPVTLAAASQQAVTAGIATAIPGLAARMSPADTASKAQGAVLLIDQTGILSGAVRGQGQLIGNGTNSLLLVGNAQDLNAELASVRVTETVAGPDTLEVEAYGSNGQTDETQLNLLALSAGQSATPGSYAFVGGNGSQTWQSSTVVLAANGTIGSEQLTWFPTDRDPTTGGFVPVTTTTIYSPLAEGGLTFRNGTLVSPAAQGNPRFNPTNGTPPGTAEFQTETLLSTTVTFNQASGGIESEASLIAPSGPAFANSSSPATNPFSAGGTIVTQFNDGSNPSWQSGWDSKLASVTNVSTANGALVEQVLEWKPGNQLVETVIVFSPYSHQEWQEIDELSPSSAYPNGAKSITEFNTGDNPNWDASDWSNALQTTTIFVTHLAAEQVTLRADGSRSDVTWYYGGPLATCTLDYAANGKLYQRWDCPTAGGYVLTQYDATGTNNFLSYVQTVNAGNHLVSLDYTWKPGQALSSTLQLFDTTTGGLQQQTDVLPSGRSMVAFWDTGATQPWIRHTETLDASGKLVSDSYWWHAGQPFVSSGFNYDLAHNDQLWQRWDTPAAGGYVLTQYDTGGSSSYSFYVQTVNAANHMVSLDYTWKTGQPYVSTLQIFDVTNGALQQQTSVLSDGESTITFWDTQGNQPWVDHIETLNAAGVVVLDHYDWHLGQAIRSSDLVYNPASGALLTRIDTSSGSNAKVVSTTASGAAAAASQSNLQSILVTDTAANVLASITVLENLATRGQLATVTLIDRGTPTLTLTTTQIAANSDVIRRIVSPFAIAATGVTASAASETAGQSDVQSVAVSDSSANVLANIVALGRLMTSGKLAGLTLTDTALLTNPNASGIEVHLAGLPDGGLELIVQDTQGTQPWWDLIRKFNAAGQLVADHYDWNRGPLATSDLNYTSAGLLAQRWDGPTSGGYILTQYNVSGTSAYAFYVQTVNARNHLVSIDYTEKPGQPYTALHQMFDVTNGALQQETQVLSSGGSTIAIWDTRAAQPWSFHMETLDGAGNLLSDHYVWDAGQPVTSSSLNYDVAHNDQLWQHWDTPASGGYILTQYDTTGTQPVSRFVQTVDAQNHIAELQQYLAPGTPASEVDTFFDATNPAIREIDTITPAAVTVDFRRADGSAYFHDTVPVQAIAGAVRQTPMKLIYASGQSEILQAALPHNEFVLGAQQTAINTLVQLAGFNPVNDLIALPVSTFGTWSDIQHDMQQTAAGALITSLTGNDRVVVGGVDPAALHRGDFLLI
jgi:hypothetical protein